MRLVGSASLIVAGAILILAVSGSVRGIDANTIGAVLVLMGFVSALVIVALRAGSDSGTARVEDDRPPTLSRR